MFYGLIDVAKHQHEVCILDHEGQAVLRLHVKSNQKGLEKLIKAMQTLDIKSWRLFLHDALTRN